jgi:hypothetical protein
VTVPGATPLGFGVITPFMPGFGELTAPVGPLVVPLGMDPAVSGSLPAPVSELPQLPATKAAKHETAMTDAEASNRRAAPEIAEA